MRVLSDEKYGDSFFVRSDNAALAEESAAWGARYVDLWGLMEKQAARKLIAGDGLHPSSLAYDAWAEALLPMLPEELRAP